MTNNILILCNGQGKRFFDEDYILPKPLINLFGKPLISHIISEIEKIKNVNIHIVFNDSLSKFQFHETISFLHPNLDISFLCIDKTTGPAETIFKSLELLSISGSFMTIDCDVIFSYLTLEEILKNSRNEIAYFLDNEEIAQFSYIKHNDGKVSEIIEKNKISNFASCGIYSFRDVNLFKSAFEKVKNQQREICPSDIYMVLLKEMDDEVFCIECIGYKCLGTPNLLKKHVFDSSNKTKIKKRFCFDIDNTIFKLNKTKDYNNVDIITENVKLIRNLYNEGHVIILHTSRNMNTYNNNLGEINKNTAPILFETLKKHDIPYHEIYFGKPVADFYIDDLAVNAFTDIQKHIGFYYENS